MYTDKTQLELTKQSAGEDGARVSEACKAAGHFSGVNTLSEPRTGGTSMRGTI